MAYDRALPGDARRGERLHAVLSFASRVLEQGRDRYEKERGGDRTPLFADGVHPATGEHVRWRPEKDAAPRPSSNLANQQNLLRALAALSELTGEARFYEAAADTFRFHFTTLQDKSGLLQWGGHRAIDLETLQAIGNKDLVHELKDILPYYDLMFAVDAQGAERFVEAFWNAHVLDWSTLEISRHGDYGLDPVSVWERPFGDPEPFAKVRGLSFISAGNDLIYAAGSLYLKTKKQEALDWMRRLAGMYVKARHPKTGLGSYQFTQTMKRREPAGDRDTNSACGDRAARQFGPEFGPDALEGYMLLPGQARSIYGANALMQLALAEQLGDDAGDLVQWVVSGLEAFAAHAYVEESNCFRPMIADGTDLTGYVLPRDGYYGPAGRTLQPFQADGGMMMAYARAFRLSGDAGMWAMVRRIGRGLGLGDVGDVTGGGAALDLQTSCADPRVVMALVELHQAQGRAAFLQVAARVADNVVAASFREGGFGHRRGIVLFDSIEPLALLSLEAAIQGKSEALSIYPGGTASTHASALYQFSP